MALSTHRTTAPVRFPARWCTRSPCFGAGEQHFYRRPARQQPSRGQQTVLSAVVDARPAQQAAETVQTTPCGVVIVGGGPAGYGAAAVLAQLGHKDIVLLERNASSDWYDGSRAYAYNIDFRGKAFLSSIGIKDLEAIGVSGPLNITYIELDGKLRDQTAFGRQFNESKDGTQVPGGTWISRHGLINRMYKHVSEKHGDVVRVEFGCRVTGVDLPGAGKSQQLRVVAETKDGRSVAWAPKLVVAADGFRSVVRKALDDAHPGGEFDVVKVPSDAAGLAFKILLLSPCPQLVAGLDRRFNNDKAVVLPGKDIGKGYPLRIGMLPNAALQEPRSANFIQWPDHKLWQVKDADELYDYLEKSFPQMNVRHVVPREEAERFVSADLGYFPLPQYCRTLFKSYSSCVAPSVADGDPLASTAGCAVVLLGDAIHAFPPDLGQGVNSALQDVAVLRECLAEGQGTAPDYHRALQQFNDRRLPDSQALIRLMQIGAPYQYRQAKKTLQKAVWTANFVVRLGLNRLAPSLFTKPAFANICYSPSYKEILDVSNNTTRALCVLGAAVAVLLTVTVRAVVGA